MTIPTPCLVTGAAIRPGQKDGAFNVVFVRWLGDWYDLQPVRCSAANVRSMKADAMQRE